MRFGIASFPPYAPLQPRRLALASALLFDDAGTGPRLAMARLLGVGFALSLSPVPGAEPLLDLKGDLLVDPRGEPTGRAYRIHLARLPKALPRAWIVPAARRFHAARAPSGARVPAWAQVADLLRRGDFDPRQEVLLESRGTDPLGSAGTVTRTASAPSEVHLRADSRRGGWLVLSDTYDPGWTATLDGQPAELLPANLVQHALRLPPGPHEVRLSYTPAGLGLGLAGAALALLLLLLLSRRSHQSAP